MSCLHIVLSAVRVAVVSLLREIRLPSERGEDKRLTAVLADRRGAILQVVKFGVHDIFLFIATSRRLRIVVVKVRVGPIHHLEITTARGRLEDRLFAM